MKKIILFLLFTAMLNAQNVAKSLMENVLLKNVNTAINRADILHENLNKKDFSLQKTRSDFAKLLYSWKQIQATYVAGDLDEDLLDTPRYIDIFHEGNEDIKEQLRRIQSSRESLEIELFKNSHKSINALEYVLFYSDKISNRDKDMAKIMLKAIKSHLQDIKQTYENQSAKFFANQTFANSALLNALINSAYKTHEWRLAEALGKSKKYDKPNKQRFEYSFSSLSVVALQAIIDAHLAVMDAPYDDFGDIAKKEAKDEVTALRKLLKETQKQLENVNFDELLSKKGERIYKNFKQIYINYALYLVTALEVKAKIIEADGD